MTRAVTPGSALATIAAWALGRAGDTSVLYTIRTAAEAALLSALAGCTMMAGAPAAPPPLEGSAWVLATLGGRPVAGPAPTARFEGGRVQGSDGCNRYTVPYTSRGASIEVGARGVSTRMACAPAVMQQADAYTAALAGARRYRVEGGRLELLGADGALLAQLAAQPQALAGTAWVATAINNGRGGVASLVAGSTVTLEFRADGRAGGSAGCNPYNAAYAAEGGRLRFTPGTMARRMCADAAVMVLEAAFMQALESVATARFERDRLELRSADNALAVLLTRKP